MPSPYSLYTVAEIRAVEQSAQANLPPFTLMARAAEAAEEYAREILGLETGQAILVLAGPGNNGGDALQAATRLAAAGMHVEVALFADAARQPPDARLALDHARGAQVRFLPSNGATGQWRARRWSLVIDGLFGIGLARSVEGEVRRAVEFVNTLDCPVLALDIPSGLDADTGRIVGGGVAIRASHTITFIGDKPGLHTAYGRDHAGEVRVAGLDIDPGLYPLPAAELNDPDQFAHRLALRPHNSHKGSYGDLAVIGGARGMAGATVLAARAAAKCGAGKVFAVFLADAPAYDAEQPELMCRCAGSIPLDGKHLVAGPGMGTSPEASALLVQLLEAGKAAVFDADALNLIAQDASLRARLKNRRAAAVITPHPLEAARLLGWSAADVQADRPAAARALAARLNTVVVLKGSGTVVARQDGRIAINPTGNPALATGGTGDVLAGVCGALLAQSWPAWEAALAAVWLHGRAADDLAGQGVGPIGMVAGELIPAIRNALNRLTLERARRR